MKEVNNHILFLEPIYHEKVWGGNNIKNKYRQSLDNNLKIGESWEISSHKHGDNKIINDNFKNMTLSELFKNNKDLFGTNFQKYNEFPLIIKYIDANDNLSIQLHPSIEQNQKNECWYIIDAEEDAQIIYGLTKNFTKEEFKNIMENNQLKNYLSYKKVKKGDFVFIPSGLVHALLKGVFVIEIQQSSDTTYRLYDWDRKEKRQLHIEEGIENILPTQVANKTFSLPNASYVNLINSNYFNIEKIKINSSFEVSTTNKTCELINIIDCDNNSYLYVNNDKYKLIKGMSFILPAINQKIIFNGHIEIIKTWI